MPQKPPPRPAITPEQAARINASVRQMNEQMRRVAEAFGEAFARTTPILCEKLAALQNPDTEKHD